MKRFGFFVIVMGVAVSANAAGYRIAEQDARANGMGNAVVAAVNNPSAVWYNPAAITDLEGYNLSLGTVLIIPHMEHQNTNGTIDRIENEVHIPPHFYATQKLNNHFSLGLGVNAPFGLSTEWDKATANTRKVATLSDIASINYNLAGAYKLNDKLSMAAGFSYVTIDATLNKWHPAAASEITLEGNGSGVGYNAAVMYKHTEKLKFGANYRSQIKVELEGDMVVSGAVTPVKTELTLPDMLQIGVAHQCTDKWLFAAEADYTNWTTYRQIVIKKQSDSTVVPGSTDIKNWKSVWAFRLGGEYKVSDAWKMRLGAFYDMNPVKERYFETRVPDADRIGLSFGAGYSKGNITVDASLLHLKFLKREIKDSSKDTTTELNGTYRSVARLPGVTVSYKF